METVKIKADNRTGYKIINRTDFDPKRHKPYEKGTQIEALTAAERDAEEKLAAARRAIANYGQQDGSAPQMGDRNPSGTFSEPTPTDVRYPNKDAVEYENNHGAFRNQSAAGQRAALGLPDAPGGVHPQGFVRKGPAGRWYIYTGDNQRNSEGFVDQASAQAELDARIGAAAPDGELTDAQKAERDRLVADQAAEQAAKDAANPPV